MPQVQFLLLGMVQRPDQGVVEVCKGMSEVSGRTVTNSDKVG